MPGPHEEFVYDGASGEGKNELRDVGKTGLYVAGGYAAYRIIRAGAATLMSGGLSLLWEWAIP